eukprot:TRINITY_DN5167_c0_g2_i1.p1 TRINITY_DN5167_c0_g2~~TRINITY_DN5167_c0_g2_i1.p1  ORF type:complete len:246 (+),score=33.22 TRINITY_DN5167_c0_g2_i1:83-820(+)
MMQKSLTAVGLMSLVAAMLITAAVSDGRSLAYLKNKEGVIGTANIKNMPLIGYPYGIGFMKDIFGNYWFEGEEISEYAGVTDGHPAHFSVLFKCDEHYKRGMALSGLCVILVFIGYFATIVPMYAAQYKKPPKELIKYSLILQGCQFIVSIFAFGLATSIYISELTCITFPVSASGTYTRQDIAYQDFMEIAYGPPALIVTSTIAIVNIVVLLATEPIMRKRALERKKKDDDDQSSSGKEDEESS